MQGKSYWDYMGRPPREDNVVITRPGLTSKERMMNKKNECTDVTAVLRKLLQDSISDYHVSNSSKRKKTGTTG